MHRNTRFYLKSKNHIDSTTTIYPTSFKTVSFNPLQIFLIISCLSLIFPENLPTYHRPQTATGYYNSMPSGILDPLVYSPGFFSLEYLPTRPDIAARTSSLKLILPWKPEPTCIIQKFFSSAMWVPSSYSQALQPTSSIKLSPLFFERSPNPH